MIVRRLLKSGDATIDRGKTASLEMTTEAFNGRVQLYGLVLTPPIGQTPNAGCCTLIPTIEIIDNATGNIGTVLSGSSVRPPVPNGGPTPAAVHEPAATGLSWYR